MTRSLSLQQAVLKLSVNLEQRAKYLMIFYQLHVYKTRDQLFTRILVYNMGTLQVKEVSYHN